MTVPPSIRDELIAAFDEAIIEALSRERPGYRFTVLERHDPVVERPAPAPKRKRKAARRKHPKTRR